MSRYYKVDKLKYPSVTTIIGDCTDKSGPLTQWAANMVCQWLRENCEEDFNHGSEEKFYEVYEDDLNNARFNFRNVSKEALDVGSEVHNLIERHLKNQSTTNMPISTQADKAFNAFLQWKKEHDIEPIAIEKTVYGPHWAGTLDFLGRMNGKLYVIDWKSSKAIYPEMRYQIAAYRWACEEQAKVDTNRHLGVEKTKTTIPVETWLTEFQGRMPSGCGILRLDKETGMPEFKDTSKSYEQDLVIFNAMVELYFARHPRIRKNAGRE